MRTHLRKPKISHRGNILIFDKGVGLDLRNEPQRRAPRELIEAERMSAIGTMACSISHDMRHSLTAIYANAEFLERDDICASVRADLLLEIQEAVLAMAERIDSLLQFGGNGRKSPYVHECVSFVVEKAVAAVKFHPDARNVSISVGKFPPAEADIDARNLESAIYNLLLNACQAATRSTHVPQVKVHLTEVDELICVTISDNGPGIPASVRRTLFDPFVTAGKPNGTGLGLTLARRIAEEHGGSVCLEESNRERTVFTLSLTKNRSLPLEDLKSDKAGEFMDSSTDVTRGTRAEEALRQAQADLARANRVTTMGELAASLAHEVIQPITATVTNANTCLRWLERDQPDLEEARAAATRILSNGKLAGDIILRIRSQFEKGGSKRELLDVNEIIRETIALLRNEAMRYNISVRTELAADLPQIIGDRVQLQQVSINLIVNSIDAMKDVDGTRDLAIKSQLTQNEQLLVSVRDTGIGLPPQQAERIFNAFFTTKIHGTGMGLRISQSIIESHGGRLWAADNSPRGATFQFTLPATVAAYM